MKSMRLPLAAIFFLTYFHRAGGHGILGPPDPLLRGLFSGNNLGTTWVAAHSLICSYVCRPHEDGKLRDQCKSEGTWASGEKRNQAEQYLFKENMNLKIL